VRVAADRDWTTSGWLETSAGRVRTTVHQHAGYLNTDTVSDGGKHQVMSQLQSGVTTVTTDPEHGPATATRHSWSYPITVDSDVALYTDGNNYSLAATVHQGRVLRDAVRRGDHWSGTGFTDDTVDATGVLARSAGVVTAADGTDSEHWFGTTDTGSCYDHEIHAAHGYVTSDQVSACRW
jgi:hypothetical protein